MPDVTTSATTELWNVEYLTPPASYVTAGREAIYTVTPHEPTPR